MVANITFLSFLLFSISKSIQVAVSTWLNWIFFYIVTYHKFTTPIPTVSNITACAVATSCCISDEPCEWEMANLDPTQLRNFLTHLCETQI